VRDYWTSSLIRPTIYPESPNNLTYDDPIRDNPAFGKAGSPYSSVDDELVARAAILRNDLTQGQLAARFETLESEGPFEPAFMADMALVYDVLHASWGKSSWWAHVKKIKGKNGRQVHDPRTVAPRYGELLALLVYVR
jgi:hypothetical protein